MLLDGLADGRLREEQIICSCAGGRQCKILGVSRKDGSVEIIIFHKTCQSMALDCRLRASCDLQASMMLVQHLEGAWCAAAKVWRKCLPDRIGKAAVC